MSVDIILRPRIVSLVRRKLKTVQLLYGEVLRLVAESLLLPHHYCNSLSSSTGAGLNRVNFRSPIAEQNYSKCSGQLNAVSSLPLILALSFGNKSLHHKSRYLTSSIRRCSKLESDDQQ